jgi:hypothetical protein
MWKEEKGDFMIFKWQPLDCFSKRLYKVEFTHDIAEPNKVRECLVLARDPDMVRSRMDRHFKQGKINVIRIKPAMVLLPSDYYGESQDFDLMVKYENQGEEELEPANMSDICDWLKKRYGN